MPVLTIYTQPTCGYCNELKDYLKKHNITYAEKDITKDKEAWNELVNTHKARATPLIIYGEKKLLGFDPEELEKLLATEEVKTK